MKIVKNISESYYYVGLIDPVESPSLMNYTLENLSIY